jgi:hypothetical protein
VVNAALFAGNVTVDVGAIVSIVRLNVPLLLANWMGEVSPA